MAAWPGVTALARRAAIAALACAAALTAGASDVPIAWGKSVPAAIETAARDRQPVLIDVWATWCKPCKRMDEVTYRDPVVLRAIAGFVPVKVDADAHGLFVDRYEIDAYPTVLVLDGTGEELARLEGFAEPAELADLAVAIREGYPGYLESQELGDDPEALRKRALFLAQLGNGADAEELLRRAVKIAKKSAPQMVAPCEQELAKIRTTAD